MLLAGQAAVLMKRLHQKQLQQQQTTVCIVVALLPWRIWCERGGGLGGSQELVGRRRALCMYPNKPPVPGLWERLWCDSLLRGVVGGNS